MEKSCLDVGVLDVKPKYRSKQHFMCLMVECDDWEDEHSDALQST